MDIGMPELLIVLVIIILLFGMGRIGKVGGELGKGIRAFRDGLNDSENDKSKPEIKPETSEATQQEKS